MEGKDYSGRQAHLVKNIREIFNSVARYKCISSL